MIVQAIRFRVLSNLVHVDTVVVLTTSETSTTGMLSVLSYTTMTGGYVAATSIC